MKGIRYVLDKNGEKTDVQIDLRLYGDLWEDIHEVSLARERADEPLDNFDEVKRLLRDDGKRLED